MQHCFYNYEKNRINNYISSNNIIPIKKYETIKIKIIEKMNHIS